MEAQIILKIIFISTFKGVKHLKFDLLYFVIFNQVKRLSLVWGEEVKNVGPVRLFAFFFFNTCNPRICICAYPCV